MNTHYVPKDIPSIISLGTLAFDAATSIGAALGLEQNTAAKIGFDLHQVIGLDGPVPILGTQIVLNQKRDALTSIRGTKRLRIAEGVIFCSCAVDFLKVRLGRRWSPRWLAVGLARNSLAIPADPLPLLIAVRGYFTANPAFELASADPQTAITAARADACITAIRAAVLQESLADAERKQAATDRDEAIDLLSKRLVGVRGELKQLLSPEDPRWRNFGFTRPVDRRTPPVVTGLTLRAGGQSGEIIAQWQPSVGAENFRVLRQVLTVDLQPIEVGLLSEPTAIIGGLPSGKTVTVSITARNEAGESLPVSASVIVA